jgi:hypothetical protein
MSQRTRLDDWMQRAYRSLSGILLIAFMLGLPSRKCCADGSDEPVG